MVAALAAADDLLRKRTWGSELTAQAVARLRSSGVKGADILPRLIACHLSRDFFPNGFHSEQAYRYAMADAFLAALPRESYRARNGERRYRYVGATAKRELGDWIHNTYFHFLRNVSNRIAADNTTTTNNDAAMRQAL